MESCQFVKELPIQSDGDAFYLHLTGGFRAARTEDDLWRIDPVFLGNKPCTTGFLTTTQLKSFISANRFKEIALHRIGWLDGIYSSHWSPIIPGEQSHARGPSDLWGSISGNIRRLRVEKLFETGKKPNFTEVGKIMDEKDPVEALSNSISLSLRSIDINMEQIVEYYHEQLINHMIKGDVDGQRSTNGQQATLLAHVHSFFLHLGAARDYLGALIAHAIGLDHEKIDSMARLVGALRHSSLSDDPLLVLMLDTGNISKHPDKPDKYKMGGWMHDVTEIRNELVHKRPYGLKFTEYYGWVVPIQKEEGIYRYFRPIHLKEVAQQDVLDFIQDHYRKCTSLFFKAAWASGRNTSMLTLTDKDITSFNIKKR